MFPVLRQRGPHSHRPARTPLKVSQRHWPMPRRCLVSERPTTERLRHEAMAKNGIVPIALDFRSGNEDPYPSSVQDINYAVRWAKLNARALKTRAELVGLSGQSSGGHLAMLVAMRPRDPRYTAIPLPAGSPA